MTTQSVIPATKWPTGPVSNQASRRRRKGIQTLTLSWPRMAQPGVSTTVTELPESRVRVQAEVSPEEIERRVAHAARQLGRSLRVPGFRPGKAPPPVVIQRIGRDAVLDEAVRDSIGSWYAAAIDAARIHPIGEPDIDMSDGLPDEGQPL